MRAVAVLLAACWLASSGLPRAALAFDEKAVLRAMEHERKAAEAEMRRQTEAEKKAIEQQQKAFRDQMKAEQKFAEQQQKALHEQQKLMQNQQKSPAGHKPSTATSAPHITTTHTTSPAYHATRPYYGHSIGHAYHRPASHTYRTMPTPVNPQTRALLRLKSSLDSVRAGSPATSSEKNSIKRALMGVVMVPKVPTIASIEALAGHLADGLANRTSPDARTSPMALTLGGALNSTDLANQELLEVMNEHRTALKSSKVRPADVTPIMESLKTVSSQERSRR